MSEEQLSFVFSEFSASQAKQEDHSNEPVYDLLDIQLADLIERLNGEKNAVLRQCTLDISKQTREGQIALQCSEKQQQVLLESKVVGQADELQPLILDKGFLYLRRYWQYQKNLAERINSRLQAVENKSINQGWLEQRLSHYFTVAPEQDQEKDWQKEAARRALQYPFLILSGGPGTGKTTTISRILALLIESVENSAQKRLKILLGAPTGKAANRMLDSIRDSLQSMDLDEKVLAQIPTQASTIHKLLGAVPGKSAFKHKRNNPLNADVVLIDEASMIDIALMTKLVEAVPDHARLILIGDKDQLASVETGSVFSDLCLGLANSSQLVTLQKNWRFDHGSAIGQLAKAANKGDHKVLLDILQDADMPDCRLFSAKLLAGRQLAPELFSPWNDYFNALKKPLSKVSELFLSELFEAFNQYRILCALRRGPNGSQIMNSRIEAQLIKQGIIQGNKDKIGKQLNNPQHSPQQRWYHGRPIMITQNDYAKGLFNGDTGIALIENGQTKVYFPDSEQSSGFKAYSPVRLPAHESNWAMTIHKSQGSEFNQVTLILPHEEMPLLTRQLIYTGITRAKQQENVIAEENVLQAGLSSDVVQATQIADAIQV